MKPMYTAIATAHAGRAGKIESSDGKLAATLSTPKELGGPGGDGTNPEQLFAAGYAACFGSALQLVARLKKVTVDGVAITAHVTLGKTDDGAFKLGVELHGKIGGVTPEQAAELMTAAHQVCPYSNATRGNVDVKLVTE
jgi:Ohr subfamily peroxiredoxin